MINTFIIAMKNPDRLRILENCILEIRQMAANGDVQVNLSDVIRTLDQNAKLWPMLTDISKQVPWTWMDGGTWRHSLMDKDDWKSVLTAAYRKETRMAHGIEGGMVMLGSSTSKMLKNDFSHFIEFIYAIGSLKGVVWSEKAKDHYEKYRPRLKESA